MQCSPLAAVKHRVTVGQPLPFNVRNLDHTLLLARGQIVETIEQMEALFVRGALVDVAELRSPRETIASARAEELPRLWGECMQRVGDTLRRCDEDGFRDALHEAAAPVEALIERDPDLAIFQVLRQEGNAHVQYGVDHSVHTGITAFLVAQRLGWVATDVRKVFNAALTMNLSMLELQGQLARQSTPLTAPQREAVLSHPQRSVALLWKAGIDDTDWLDAVAHHHVCDDGTGYPAGVRDVSDLAALVRRADIYTAKLSSRGDREAMAADRAGRAMFMQDPGNSMTAALVKEFGVYPPGCFVKLASGETAVVVRRGASVITPVVAVLTTPSGTPLTEPQRRDTAGTKSAITGVVGERSVSVKPAPEKLMTLATA